MIYFKYIEKIKSHGIICGMYKLPKFIMGLFIIKIKKGAHSNGLRVSGSFNL